MLLHSISRYFNSNLVQFVPIPDIMVINKIIIKKPYTFPKTKFNIIEI